MERSICRWMCPVSVDLRAIAFLIAASLGLTSQLSWADEVKDKLDEAINDHIAELRRIEQDAMDYLDAQVDKYSDEGNLERVLELRLQKQRMISDRAWPSTSVSIQRKLKLDQARADRKLREAYKDAIADLTRTRQYEAAVELKKELEKLTSLQEELRERPNTSSSRNPKVVPQDVDDQADAPDEVQDTPKGQPQTGNRPTKLAENVALAQAFEQAYKTSAAVNPLLKSNERQDELRRAFNLTLAKMPPALWTPAQVQNASAFFDNLPGTVPLDSYPIQYFEPIGNGRLQPNAMGGTQAKDLPIYWLYIPWLQTSQNATQFAERLVAIRGPLGCHKINAAVRQDEIKAWLKAIGRSTPNDAWSCLMDVKKHGGDLQSIDELLPQLAPQGQENATTRQARPKP
jgi:hypothetical protein